MGEKVEPGEEDPIVLRVGSPTPNYGHMCEICLKPCQTIFHLKYWITMCFPGLKLPQLQIAKKDAGNIGYANMLAFFTNSDTIRDATFADGDEVIYCYIGDADGDMA